MKRSQYRSHVTSAVKTSQNSGILGHLLLQAARNKCETTFLMRVNTFLIFGISQVKKGLSRDCLKCSFLKLGLFGHGMTFS